MCLLTAKTWFFTYSRNQYQTKDCIWVKCMPMLKYVALESIKLVLMNLLTPPIQTIVLELVLFCHMTLLSALFLYLMWLNHFELMMFMLEYFLTKLASPQFITVASLYREIHLMIVIFYQKLSSSTVLLGHA